jgi:hypothetical protein
MDDGLNALRIKLFLFSKIRVDFDGILIADCERHRTLYTPYEAVRGPGMVLGPRTVSYAVYRFSVLAQSSTEMP